MTTEKINLDQYPQLKLQADYIIKVEGLIVKLKTKRSLLLKKNFTDPELENDRLIAIDKTDLEIQTLERQMVEKKTKYDGLIAVLEDTLKEMESSFDGVIKDVLEVEPEFSIEYDTEEGKLDIYLRAKERLRGIKNVN